MPAGTYPTYRQDFEGGSTLAAACPELNDLDSAYSIDSSGSHALTGTHSLHVGGAVVNHTIISAAADTLSGDVTLTAYINNGSNNASLNMYARGGPTGIQPTSYQRLSFGPTTGISIQQAISGVLSTLNTPISGVTLPTGVWLCFELRCHGTTISARIVRQDNGQFFVNSGSGSWSSSPQTQSGTATLAAAAGGFGLRLGDNIGVYADDLIIEPAVASIDNATFSLSGTGSTQQLTAGGFTDPLFGVTWSSSNTGVATVSSSGLVTAVAAGSATITATGKRDTSQTATAAATITTTGATTYTFSGPSPLSGYANNTSGTFTVTPNGVYTGTVTITPTTGFNVSVITQTWTASSTPWTFTITPNRSGPVTMRPTNSGGLTDPSTLVYTALPQGLSVGPLTLTSGVLSTVTFTGTGTLWMSTAPTISAAGPAGTVVGATAALSDTTATATVTPGLPGTVWFSDSTTGATASATIVAAVARTGWNYLGSVYGFSAGLLGSVGYTVLRADGTTYAARSQAGVFAVGSCGYAAPITLPLSGAYLVLWDDGAGHQAFESIIPRGVEPTSTSLPGGLNDVQTLSEILAVLTGLVSGFVAGAAGHPIFLAPDGSTPRVVGDVDAAGNRSNLTLTPPQ